MWWCGGACIDSKPCLLRAGCENAEEAVYSSIQAASSVVIRATKIDPRSDPRSLDPWHQKFRHIRYAPEYPCQPWFKTSNHSGAPTIKTERQFVESVLHNFNLWPNLSQHQIQRLMIPLDINVPAPPPLTGYQPVQRIWTCASPINSGGRHVEYRFIMEHCVFPNELHPVTLQRGDSICLFDRQYCEIHDNVHYSDKGSPCVCQEKRRRIFNSGSYFMGGSEYMFSLAFDCFFMMATVYSTLSFIPLVLLDLVQMYL